MTLNQWLLETWKFVTFSDEYYDDSIKKTVKIDPVNIDLSTGLLSTESLEEFSDLAFAMAPSGTIYELVEPHYYNGRLLLIRQILTKMIIFSKDKTSVDKYLAIMERRDSQRWAKRDMKMLELSKNQDNGTLKIQMIGM